jgi:hypothetical protein
MGLLRALVRAGFHVEWEASSDAARGALKEHARPLAHDLLRAQRAAVRRLLTTPAGRHSLRRRW